MTNSSMSKAVLAGCIFLSMSACFFACMYFFNPRVKIEYRPIPGPAPSPPDSVVMVTDVLTENYARLRMSELASERTIAELHRQLSIRAIEKALPTTRRWTIPPEDTAVGLKLYRSDKTFIHPTMYFGSIESHIEATAPAPVTSFMNTIRFMDGDQAVVDRIQKQYRIENPCPPGHFWTGFGYGGMTGFGLALVAALLIGGI